MASLSSPNFLHFFVEIWKFLRKKMKHPSQTKEQRFFCLAFSSGKLAFLRDQNIKSYCCSGIDFYEFTCWDGIRLSSVSESVQAQAMISINANPGMFNA